MPRDPAIESLLARLADPEDAAELVGAAFDHIIDQPLERYVGAEQFLEHIDRAFTQSAVERFLREHLRPFYDREAERAKKRGDRLGDWLTPEAIAELRAVAARPVNLDKRFLDGLVKQDAVAQTMRAVVEDTLDRFLSSLSPAGSGGGRLGSLGRSAVGFGKGLLGGLGAQLEGQLKRAANGFIQTSMAAVTDRLVVYLARPETARQLGRMNLAGFEQALKLRTDKVLAAGLRLPIDDLLEVLPGVIAHNLSRDEVRAGLLDEIEIALEIEGKRTLREILADHDAVDAWRSETVLRGRVLVGEFATSEAFTDWLDG